MAMYYGTKGNAIKWLTGTNTDWYTGITYTLNLDDPKAPYHGYGMFTGEGLFRGFGNIMVNSTTSLPNIDIFASDNPKNIVVINKDQTTSQTAIFGLNGADSGTIDVWRKDGSVVFMNPPVHVGSFNFQNSTFTYTLTPMSATTFVINSSGGSTTPIPTSTPTPYVSPTPTPANAPTPTSYPSTAQSVTSFTLWNAQTNAAVTTLNNGATVNLSGLPASCLNIRANTNPYTVGSVEFGYDGNSSYHTENVVPYDIGGDTSVATVPNCWTLTAGSHTLTATPYTSSNTTGTAGQPLTINFTATITTPVTPMPTPTPVPPTPTPVVPTATPAPLPTATPAPILSTTPRVSVPTCIFSGYTGTGVNISWSDSTVTWTDISSDSAFSSFYNKSVSGTMFTTAPSGFNGYGFSGTRSLNPTTTYYVRTWNNSVHSPTTTFTTPACTSSAPTPTSAPVASMTVVAQDSFQRANQTYWGTASDGQIWSGDANSNTAFAIYNGTGQMSKGWQPLTGALGPNMVNQQVLFAGSLNSFNYTNLGAVLRWNNNSNWYKAYFDGSNLNIQKDLNGSTKILTSAGFKATTNTAYIMRFQVSGNTLSVKVWPNGTPEPAGWMLNASDSSLASGRAGLRAQLQTGATVTYNWFSAMQLP
ncbi:MAG: hypothetical protein M1543_02235 [Firmicutes bacterium]|nr:hypothetical protein [Bacillota bacterium]